MSIVGTGGVRVDDPAVAPDLSLCPGEYFNLPHLEHGPGEPGAECRLAAHKGVDERLHGGVGQQCRIRLEEAQVVGEPKVVLVVELCRREEVHERCCRRERLVAVRRADTLEQERISLAQRRINLLHG